MLGIAHVNDEQAITVKPAIRWSEERGVYLAPVTWTGQTMMFCITPTRLLQEFTQTMTTGADLASVFDPETYRNLKGEGVYLDYYGYTPLEPGKSKLAYRTGVGVCSMTVTGKRYTRADVLRLCHGEEAVADRLFDLCEDQELETILADEATLYLPLFSFDQSLDRSMLIIQPEAPLPDASQQILLQQAGWQERLSRCWTHEGNAPVPYGIAYVSSEPGIVKTIRIEPTPNGYRTMKQLFQQSVETYREKLQILDQLLNLSMDRSFPADMHVLLEEMVTEKHAAIEDAIESLSETITELERCGY